jgi:spermidine/putrescine transport system substrate-binding protein
MPTPDPDRRADLEGVAREVDRLRDGRISRAQFLRRTLALGLSLPTASLLLSACGAGDSGGGSTGGSATATAPSVPEKLTGPLAFLNWGQWIAPKEIPTFEKQTGVKVRQSFFTNNEDLLSKLRTSSGAYDVAVPGTNAVQILIATDGLEKLNQAWLPNTKTMLPRFVKTPADPTSSYSVPNDWSFHGIGVRRDKVSEDIRGWADLWKLKDKYSGKITVLDDQRDTIGAALCLLGYSYNSKSKKEIDEATAKLIELKPHLLAVTSTNQREMLLSGQAYLTMDWNQSVAGAHQEDKQADFVIPDDGTGYYVDFLVIPKGSKNVYSAHRFMDFLQSPEQYAAFVRFTSTPWTNGNVEGRLPKWMGTSEWLNPPPTAKLEYQLDVGDATPLYGDAWTRFKSA